MVAWALLLRPRVRLATGAFGPADLLLVAFVLSLGLTLLASTHVARKNVNHFVAYCVVIGAYYFFVKFLFTVEDSYAHYGARVRSAVAASVLLVSAYAVVEFLDANFFQAGLTSLVRFPDEQQSYRATFLVFTRARGFMVESGFLALFLNAMAPMSFVHLRLTRGLHVATAFGLVTLAAFVATFSVAGLTFLALGVLAAVLMFVYDRAVVLVPLRSTTLLGLGAVAALLLAVALPGQVWTPIVAKLTLSDLSSGSTRLDLWTDAVSVALEHPFVGTGIGSTSRDTGAGVISFYLTILKEAGVVTAVLIVFFLGSVCRRIVLLPATHPYKYAFALSFVAAVGHYAVMSDIWYPWLWFLCAVVAWESGRG